MPVLHSPVDGEKHRVLVTGGAGFIGSRLVSILLDQGHHVIVLDNYWTSQSASLGRLKSNPRLTSIQADVTKIPDDVPRCTQIYHLACPASPVHFTTEPLRILDTCFFGTRNVLEKARLWNARVLLASTSEVYGQAERDPQDESYFGNVNCFGPRSCYDEGKRVSESLAYAYRVQHGTSLEICIARIFNAYGPGMHASDGRVVCSFIGKALAGEDMIITGDGDSTRCFQYVDDCVDGLIRLMNSGWQGGPINIGNEKETTIRDLASFVAKAVADVTGRQANISYRPALPDDPLQRRPDCTLARRVLDWSAQTSLDEGLRRTISWHLSLPTTISRTPYSLSTSGTESKEVEAIEA